MVKRILLFCSTVEFVVVMETQEVGTEVGVGIDDVEAERVLDVVKRLDGLEDVVLKNGTFSAWLRTLPAGVLLPVSCPVELGFVKDHVSGEWVTSRLVVYVVDGLVDLVREKVFLTC